MLRQKFLQLFAGPQGRGFSEEQRDRYAAEIIRCIALAKEMEVCQVGLGGWHPEILDGRYPLEAGCFLIGTQI